MTRGLTLLTENTWCNLAVRILKKENIFGRKEKNQRTNTIRLTKLLQLPTCAL